jgi:hypothetical protein
MADPETPNNSPLAGGKSIKYIEKSIKKIEEVTIKIFMLPQHFRWAYSDIAPPKKLATSIIRLISFPYVTKTLRS